MEGRYAFGEYSRTASDLAHNWITESSYSVKAKKKAASKAASKAKSASVTSNDNPNIVHMKIGDLIPDAHNANKGSERGSSMLEDSLRKYGAGRSILLDKKGRIIAGNKTSEQAGQIGMEDVIVIKTDGTKLVAVQRTDLDLEEDANAKALGILDNRVSEISLTWDAQVLAELGNAVDLSQFFTTQELAKIIVDESNAQQKALTVSENLVYRVIVECKDESQQVEIMQELESRGIKCKLMIS